MANIVQSAVNFSLIPKYQHIFVVQLSSQNNQQMKLRTWEILPFIHPFVSTQKPVNFREEECNDWEFSPTRFSVIRNNRLFPIVTHAILRHAVFTHTFQDLQCDVFDPSHQFLAITSIKIEVRNTPMIGIHISCKFLQRCVKLFHFAENNKRITRYQQSQQVNKKMAGWRRMTANQNAFAVIWRGKFKLGFWFCKLYNNPPILRSKTLFLYFLYYQNLFKM